MEAILHTTRQMPSVKESVIFKQNTEWTSSSCFWRRLRTRPHYGEYQGPCKKDLKKLPLPPRKMSAFRGPFPSEFPLPSVGRVLIFSGTTQSHDRIARVMPQPLQLPITTCLQANRFYGTLPRSRIDSSRICQKPRYHSGLKIGVHWAHVDISPFQFASNKED